MILKTYLLQICAASQLFRALIARAEAELATGFKWKFAFSKGNYISFQS